MDDTFIVKIKKSCENCIHLASHKMCSPYCDNYSSHEFTCAYCKYKYPKGAKFCEMDDGDDGMSCCGDKFELNPNFQIEK